MVAVTTPSPTPSPPSGTQGSSTTVRAGRRVGRAPDRQMMIVAAVVLAIGILGGAAAVAIFSKEPSPDDVRRNHAAQVDARPRIIAQPNSGTPPEQPGDRGGWEQLALLAILVVAVGGIGVVGLRGGRKARAGRAAWAAAADAGDGAIDGHRPPGASLP